MDSDQGRLIDLSTWKRRDHFELFRRAAQPFFSVTVDLDVTAQWQRRHDGPESSFFLPVAFALLQAADASEPFRMRLRDDGVWVHERVSLGATVLRSDDTFGFARLDPQPTYEQFRRIAGDALERSRTPAPLNPMHGIDDLIYLSSLPWLRFTSFNNALDRDSIPRVAFGKVFQAGSTWRMPLGIEVHHALVDGLDVGRFVGTFEDALKQNVNAAFSR